MSDGITDGEREAKKNFERWKRPVIENFLSTLPTEDLIGELCKRDNHKKYLETWKQSVIVQLISTLPIDDLITELCKRKGVRSYTTEPNVKYSVEDETGQYEVGDGSARILVIKDEREK